MFSSEGLCPETKQLLSSTTKKKGKGGGKGGPANEEEPKTDSQPVSINLHFKRYVFDPHKKMVQSWHSVTVLQTGSFRGPVEVREHWPLYRAVWLPSSIGLFFWGWRQSAEMQWLWECWMHVKQWLFYLPFMEMDFNPVCIITWVEAAPLLLMLLSSLYINQYFCSSESILLTCSKTFFGYVFLFSWSLIDINILQILHWGFKRSGLID